MRRKYKPLAGRYAIADLTERIEALREKRCLTATVLARKIGIPKWSYSRKVSGDGSRFTVEEIGAIADALDAPPGWPFLDPDLGEFLAAAEKAFTRIH